MASLSSQLMTRLIRATNTEPYQKIEEYHKRPSHLAQDCSRAFANKLKAQVGFWGMIPIAAAESAIAGSGLAIGACYGSGEDMRELREQFQSSLFTLGWSAFNASFNFAFYIMVEEESGAQQWCREVCSRGQS